MSSVQCSFRCQSLIRCNQTLIVEVKCGGGGGGSGSGSGAWGHWRYLSLPELLLRKVSHSARLIDDNMAEAKLDSAG